MTKGCKFSFVVVGCFFFFLIFKNGIFVYKLDRILKLECFCHLMLSCMSLLSDQVCFSWKKLIHLLNFISGYCDV